MFLAPCFFVYNIISLYLMASYVCIIPEFMTDKIRILMEICPQFIILPFIINFWSCIDMIIMIPSAVVQKTSTKCWWVLADKALVQLYGHMCLLSILVSAPPKKLSSSAYIVAGKQHTLHISYPLTLNVLMDWLILRSLMHVHIRSSMSYGHRMHTCQMVVRSLLYSTSNMK
jgi:hypothetical protein